MPTYTKETALYDTGAIANGISALDESLDQLEIFNRLTNNSQNEGIYLENGHLYVNASYIHSGTFSANYISGGTLKLGGLNNTNGILEIYDGSNVLTARFNSTTLRTYNTDSGSDFYGSYADLNNGSFSFTAKYDNTEKTALELYYELEDLEDDHGNITHQLHTNLKVSNYLYLIPATGSSINVAVDGNLYCKSATVDGNFTGWGNTVLNGPVDIYRNSPYIRIHSEKLDSTAGETIPSATTSVGVFTIRDLNNYSCGFWQINKTAADLLYTQHVFRRYDSNGNEVSHSFNLLIAADGTRTVTFSAPDAWCAGLGAVKTSGDTITGGIIHDDAQSYYDSSNVTRGTFPSSQTYSNARINFRDKSNNSLAQIRMISTSSYQALELSAFKDSNTAVALRIGYDSSGNPYVYTGSASAWRSALGLAADSSWTTVAPVIAKKQGNVVTVSSNGNHSSAIPVNTYTDIATLPSGYRPSTTVYAVGMLRSTNPCVVRINSSGVVAVYSGTASAASGTLRFSLSFVI